MFRSSDKSDYQRDAFVFALLDHFHERGLQYIRTRPDTWDVSHIHFVFQIFLFLLEAEGVDVHGLQFFKDRTMGTYEGVSNALSRGAIDGALHHRGPQNDGFYYFSNPRFKELLPMYLKPLSEDEKQVIGRVAPVVYEAYQFGTDLTTLGALIRSGSSRDPDSPETA